ncbi:MAG: VWA domain-containing protein [Rhodobacteraceae bacterium]|jgi:Ca-activated chloride channel family protein|nr:VWA domain-containing protein [Paracoccaceae bacterium]
MRLYSLVAGIGFASLSALPAFSEGRSIIVLDASGSMWGQIDGRAKLEIAREALAEVLGSLPAETELGLMAYGHRTAGDCGDIELVVPPAAGTGPAISQAAAGLNFLGKTPLTESVRQAALALRSSEEKATVILITDGIETCDADPCALGAELESTGVDFTAHVVGFGLSAEEGASVACLADNTGGVYIEASSASTLKDALQTTVVAAPEPAPEPEPAPAPQPAALENNVDPILLLAEGGQEPEDRILQDAVFTFTPLGADGQPAGDDVTVYGRSLGAMAPGPYQLKTELHRVTVTQQVVIGPATELSQPTVVLNAGILSLTLRPSPGADPAPEAFWEIRGANDLYDNGYAQTYRVFPAGEHALMAQLGAAKTDQTVVIDPGQTTTMDLVIGVGLAVVNAFYAEGMKVETGDHAVEVLEAKQALDGSRKSVSYTYGADAQFELPPGDYVAVATLGFATAETPFTVKVGERADIPVLLNAGVLFVSAPGANVIEVLDAKADIQGNRISRAYEYTEAGTFTAPAGDYLVRVTRGEVTVEATGTVKAGERTELAVP